MKLLIGYWSPASISALAALFGSLVGALGSGIGSWITQQHQNRRDLLAKQLIHREQLYSDFISETAQVFVDAAQHVFQDPSRLVPSYALLSRMRLSSSKNVVDSAERVLKTILDRYSQPNLTAEEIHAWASERNNPLREFSNICRHDLESLGNGL